MELYNFITSNEVCNVTVSFNMPNQTVSHTLEVKVLRPVQEAQQAPHRQTRRGIQNERGFLSSYGYSKTMSMTLANRQSALADAAATLSKDFVIDRLQYLEEVARTTNPIQADLFKTDAQWLAAVI